MADLRITSGELGGRRIKAPPRRNRDLRPTTEKVREAIFSLLGESVEGARVLDLFCGTGALGIEAISRGAARATFVDSDSALVRANVEALELAERIEVVRADATRYLDRAPVHGFDLVLCDPPYGLVSDLNEKLGPLFRRALAPGGRVMIETSVKSPLDVRLPLITERAYGDTLVRIHAGEAERE
jgi:16S rRNA (guanine966-N2)-methyltransferase